MHRVVTVFGASASRPGDEAYEQGVLCGRLLAEAGFAVATGGYGGLMEAVSKGAVEADGVAIGVTVPDAFTVRDGANEFVTEERRAASLVERIHEMTDISDASIALEGSIGTLTELMVAWNLAYITRFGATEPKPVIAVGRQWKALVPHLTAAVGTDGTLVTVVADVEEAVDAVVTALEAPT